jgi:catechol 2,3-dioxygenase-like lactoylglutathione lyase family enzyme
LLFGVRGDAAEAMKTYMQICAAFVALLLAHGSSNSAQSETGRPKILGLTFVRIGVGNLESAKQFYTGELRLPVLPGSCLGEDARCFFVNPDQLLELVKVEVPGQKNLITEVGLSTSDAKGLRNYLLVHGLKPSELITDSKGRVSFKVKDPELHTIEFVESSEGFGGSISGLPALSKHAIHAGFIVKNRALMDNFYKDILGFHLYWSGGMKDGETNWVSMQVPDGTDWIEYMLNVDPNADQRLRGVMNHIALGVPSVKAAAIQLEKNGVKLTEQPKIGRDGKWQLNLYDPDLTRVELMEFTPVEQPCCSEFTGTHPKP